MTQNSTELLLLERQAEIRRRLAVSERVIAGDLAQEFRVSDDTIRRDLRELAAAGQCIRVYGGALPVPAKAPDTPLSVRIGANLEHKQRLAAAMADFAERGMTIFLDAGSTNLAAAQLLPGNLDLTVATHAPHIAAAIIDRPGIRLFMIGGKVDEKVGAATGAQAMRDMERLRPDMAFIGACAIDAATGVTAFDAEDAEFKRLLMQQARIKLAASINEKIGTVAPYPVRPVAAFDYIVIEKSLDPHKKAALDLAQAVLVSA
ncbi:MAG: DeoR/GlpR family DNA-binding transcription regulator [Rhizobiaceae bacterium]